MKLARKSSWIIGPLASLMVFIGIVELSPHAYSAIDPFTSDGCSSFPDGTLAQQDLWLNCCTAHDVAYWQGGTYQQRLDADKTLRQCVREVGEPAIAELMLAGVRVGGSPYWPTKFRWGYGWPWPRGYKAVTAEEQLLIDAAIVEQPPEH